MLNFEADKLDAILSMGEPAKNMKVFEYNFGSSTPHRIEIKINIPQQSTIHYC